MKNLKNKKLKFGDKYEIGWIDTFSHNGWFSDKEIERLSKNAESYIWSTGYFVSEVSGFIILASQFISNDFNATDRYGHPNWIPKGCISVIHKVK